MSDHPLADGTDAGALAVILDECKGGPWKPDDGTSLWFYNAAGDQIHLTGDDVALLLHAALAGAAPRADGLDVERPMPFVQRVWPPFKNRDQELAQAFREAVALTHEHGTKVTVWRGLENKPLHPNVEDADYNCPNEWCQRFWAMVREAEDRAGADRGGLDEEIEARAQGGPSVIDVAALEEAIAEAMNHVPWPGEDGAITFGGLTYRAAARAIAARLAPEPSTRTRDAE